MDVKKIKALLRVVELGSLTSAADELGYSQPGLTNMMNSLESETGITLLIRGKAGVHLTSAGYDLLPYFQKLVSSAESLEKELEVIKLKNAITFRVGAYSSVARHWLPAILERFKSFSPDTDMIFSMQDIKSSYDAVRNGDMDCAIVSYQKDLMSGLRWTPLKDDPLVAVLPGSYNKDEGSFPVSYFADMDFLVPSGGWELDYVPAFSECKKLPNFKKTNLDDGATASMIAHGLGVSIMSELVMQGISENVAVVPISPPSSRKLGIIARSGINKEKEIKRFIAIAKETLESM